MAEFQEVVRQYGRLCDTMHYCSFECPLHSLEDDGVCTEFMRKNPKEFETVVMKWAADHPEKTLKDVLLEHFPNAPISHTGEPDACPGTLGLILCPKMEEGDCSCLECWNRPAPEEAAK